MAHDLVRPRWVTVIAFVVLVFPTMAAACLWDYDTLQQERSRFPTALELMTGRFPRHSPEFYRWRLEDRKQKLAASAATPELLDDLAVSYDKLGDPAQAIATMLDCERQFPGRYETAANLGTFYFHAGQFQEGIPHIERAIQINPDAHFGREVYQLKLVKYLMSRSPNGQLRLPLAEINPEEGSLHSGGFRDFILTGIATDQHDEKTARAVRGIQGMMRFGKFDSPVLLEALGDLWTVVPPGRDDANQLLAARAFLRASQVAATSHPEAAAAYRKRAEFSLTNQMGGTGFNGQMTLADLEPQLLKEWNSAQEWYAGLVADERNWIAESPDPEASFTAKYQAKYSKSDQQLARGQYRSLTLQLLAWGVAAVAALYLVNRVARSQLIGNEKTPISETLPSLTDER